MLTHPFQDGTERFRGCGLKGPDLGLVGRGMSAEVVEHSQWLENPEDTKLKL